MPYNNYAESKVNHLLEMTEEVKNEVSSLVTEIQETAKASYTVGRKFITKFQLYTVPKLIVLIVYYSLIIHTHILRLYSTFLEGVFGSNLRAPFCYQMSYYVER